MKDHAATPALKILTASQAKATFSDLLTKTGFQGHRIVIKKGTRPTAVILGYEDFQRLADLEDRYESALLSASLKKDHFVTLDDVTRRLGL